MDRKRTTKEHLTSFFVLVTGTSLLICLFTLIFCLIYNQRYQKAIRQMTEFSVYCEDLDLAVNALNHFVTEEEETYKDRFSEYLESAESSIESLYEMENNPEILREVRDIQDMTEYLKQKALDLCENMESYLQGEITAFSDIETSLQEVKAVYTAIDERYFPISKMILSDVSQSYTQAQKKSMVFVTFFILFFLGDVAVMIVQIQNVSASISEPISVLTRKAEQIRSGGLNDTFPAEIPPYSDFQLRVLLEVFNDMICQVKKQFETAEENARVRHELEVSRFKELQMQINPHFLFNTMNMIAETAYFENADETVALLESAARMFRFSLDFSGKTVTLFREIEELGNYVLLQEKRFGDRIHFYFELDESFHEILVPALTLQPLIENSIVHGVGIRTENANVYICTSYHPREKKGYIIVKDNGIGMSPEKLSEVRKGIQEYSVESPKIGLGNVYLRLKYLFGEAARLDIESAEGKGTQVTIALPFEKKGGITSCIG